MSSQWDGYPLDLGLVVEGIPTEFSCTCNVVCSMHIHVNYVHAHDF